MKRFALVIALTLFTMTVSAQAPTITSILQSATCPGSGCVALGMQGMGALAVQVTGTFSGTLTFEGSLDGVNYVATALTPAGGSSAVTTTPSTGVWSSTSVGGFGMLRVRFSSYVSGAATVTTSAAIQ